MTVLISVLLAVLSAWIQRGRRQALAVATIRRRGGNVTYDYMSRQHPDGSISYGRQVESPVPILLIQWLGIDCFHDVVSVQVDSGSFQSVWDAIGQFPETTRLVVSGRQPPTDASSLSKLRRLRSLSISGDMLRDQELRHLENAIDLDSVSIHGGTFDGCSFQYLAALPKLRTLHLVDATVSDDELAPLANSRSLQHLTLFNCTINDSGISHLTSIPSLTFLKLNQTSVSDDGILKLCQSSALRIVSLEGTGVTNQGLASLGMVEHLEHLELGQTYVTGEGVRWPDSLLSLDVSNSHVDDRGLARILEITSLKRVAIGGTRVTDDGVENARRVRPDVTLDFSR